MHPLNFRTNYFRYRTQLSNRAQLAQVEKFHVGIFGPTEGQSAGSCTNMNMKAVDWRGGGCA